MTKQSGEPPILNACVRAIDAPEKALSSREIEMLVLLASGHATREAALLLGVSVKTGDTHRGNVLKKLKLRGNADLTRYALQHGYITIDGYTLTCAAGVGDLNDDDDWPLDDGGCR